MVMNERVMQFRIGMFVIVAGLVLTMLIIWFGEAPSLFRDNVYVIAHYLEAPGVSEGVPVRKSGIRIGEVTAIAFDQRPNQPDGVLVTLSLERKYKIKAGSVPQITRSLIGDVTIDMLPGEGPGLIPTGATAVQAPIIEGSVVPDPSKALAAATQVFEKTGGTLKAIEEAAKGLSKVTKNADHLDEFLATWSESGKKVSVAAQSIDRFIRANEADFQPTVTNLREVSRKLNETLDPQTQAAFKAGIDRFSTASARLDSGLANLAPVLKDLGAPVNLIPTTNFGQAVLRLNRITSDINLLTRALNDGQGNLNANGSLQRFVTRTELYDNLNSMAVSANYAFDRLKPILVSLRKFAETVANDPGALARGALRR
jgi:phospholipid/cholesterol/gamma-HCH transport system substrate-binding protein